MKFGAYQPIYKAGNSYYISGQVGVDPNTMQAKADIKSQVAQAMDNLGGVLTSNGLGFENIAKTTLFLANIDDFNEVNEVYGGYFSGPKPARSTVAVKDLPKVGGKNKILFEIEAVAYKGGN